MYHKGAFVKCVVDSVNVMVGKVIPFGCLGSILEVKISQNNNVNTYRVEFDLDNEVIETLCPEYAIQLADAADIAHWEIKNKKKCVFTTNITEDLDCDPIGNFDNNGFPINRCEHYPCPKYLKIKT
jgi:hypothetical protein